MDRRALCHKAISSWVSSGPASPAARLNARRHRRVGLRLAGDAQRVEAVALALAAAPAPAQQCVSGTRRGTS